MTAKNPTPPTYSKDPFSFGAFTPSFESLPDTVQPMMQFGTKFQSEFMALCSQRSQAWLGWPEVFVACETVTDIAEAQTNFFTAMQRDYARYFDCILRDTLIEQDEFTEQEETVEPAKDTDQPAVTHRKAA